MNRQRASVIDPSLRAIRNMARDGYQLGDSVIDPSLRAIRNHVVLAPQI